MSKEKRKTQGLTIERGVVRGGVTVHQVNPSYLIEKIIREQIFETLYWKERCFGLTAATLCDRAAELKIIGGQNSNLKPTPFICLLFKMIQLQPENDIVHFYLKQPHFKYLSMIAAFYIRLIFPAIEIYKSLEPFLNDYRKLRAKEGDGAVYLTHVDEFIDDLLTKERVCGIALPRLTKREILEDNEGLEPRVSLIQSEIESSSDDSD